MGGTGAVGRALGARLAATGVPVLLGSRDAARAQEAAQGMEGGPAGPVEGAANEQVVERSDVVVLAVPFAGVGPLLESFEPLWRPGALALDVTVPLRFEGGRPVLEMPPEGSAAEHLRARLPERVRLAAALKTIPAHALGALEMPLECDTFVCGDSPEATRRAMDVLARIPSLRPVDVGGLEAARALEHMTWLAVRINKRHKVRMARFRVVGL